MSSAGGCLIFVGFLLVIFTAPLWGPHAADGIACSWNWWTHSVKEVPLDACR